MPGLPFVRVTGHPAIGVASPPFYSTAVAVKWVLSFDAIRVNASLISVRLAQVLEAILEVSTRLRLSGLVMTRCRRRDQQARLFATQTARRVRRAAAIRQRTGTPRRVPAPAHACYPGLGLQFRYYISGIKAFTATVKSIELAAILEHGAGCQQYLLASRDSTPVPLL